MERKNRMFISTKVVSLTAVCVIFTSHIPRSLASEPCKQDRQWLRTEASTMSLSLPDSIQNMIRSEFPAFRIPGQSDMKGAWATDTEPGKLPYFAEGDFNGDGLCDFALVLAGEREYRLVIFHAKPDCSYSVGYKTSHPWSQDVTLQNVFIATIPKDEEKKVESIAPGDKVVESVKYHFKTDALEWTTFGAGVSLLHWKNGKYESIDLGSE